MLSLANEQDGSKYHHAKEKIIFCNKQATNKDVFRDVAVAPLKL